VRALSGIASSEGQMNLSFSRRLGSSQKPLRSQRRVQGQGLLHQAVDAQAEIDRVAVQVDLQAFARSGTLQPPQRLDHFTDMAQLDAVQVDRLAIGQACLQIHGNDVLAILGTNRRRQRRL
jgi:hypothetical protein